MTVADATWAAVALIWLLATIAYQLQGPLPPPSRFAALYRAGLVPRWTFFGPVPGTTDFLLLAHYRLLTGEERIVEVRQARAPRWRSWLWNPERRRLKAMTDCVQGLSAMIAVELPERALVLTQPYLSLLYWVSERERPLGAIEVRFSVVVRSPERSPDERHAPLFTSLWHALSSP